jgi:hypothetical protein
MLVESGQSVKEKPFCIQAPVLCIRVVGTASLEAVDRSVRNHVSCIMPDGFPRAADSRRWRSKP